MGGAVVEEIMYVFSRWAGDQFNLIFGEEKQEGYAAAAALYCATNIFLGQEETMYVVQWPAANR